MINDFFTIFYWWLIVSGLGVVFTPLTFKLFPKFFDRGYAFSKIIGILIVSYVVWLLGSLKILQFVPEAVWLVVLGGAVANLALFRKKQEEFLKSVKEILKIIAFEELLFFVCLLTLSIVRGFNPQILNIEKFMDFSLLNTILRSKHFPPADPWLSGFSLNYYYFGQFLIAVLTKLSGLPSSITYNLGLASVFALAGLGSFSLVFNCTKNYFTSLLSFVLLALCGNLDWAINFLKGAKGYWYPQATRLIPYTISEFPAYSFLLGDLHAHLLDIPLVLLIMALLLNLFLDEKRNWSKFALLPLALGATALTSSWDFPIYSALIGLVFFLLRTEKSGFNLKTLITTAPRAGTVVFLSLLLFLPFFLNFKAASSGVGLVTDRSAPSALLTIFGFFLLLGLSYLPLALPKTTKRSKTGDLLIFLLPWGFFLAALPEILFLKDIYYEVSPLYYRANTMFKVHYQAWITLSLASALAFRQVENLLKKNRSLRGLWLILFSFFLLGSLGWTANAAKTSYGNFKNYQGLDGAAYLEERYPEELAAIKWLSENVTGQPIILEAAGESYSEFSRVSSYTGLPTVIGWSDHEFGHRGSFDEIGPRIQDVKEIYESPNLKMTKGLLKKYEVEYVYLGGSERQKYPQISEEKFSNLGEVVFQNGGVKIFRIANQ